MVRSHMLQRTDTHKRLAAARARKARHRARQLSRPVAPITFPPVPTIRVSAAGAPRWTTLGVGSRASSLTHGDARGGDVRVREKLAAGVKRVTVGTGRAVHVDHRACLPDPVHGLHNVSLRCIWRFDAGLRGGGQAGACPVQILRGGHRTDIRRPWPDRYWAGPAAAAADHWQAVIPTTNRTPLTHGDAEMR